MSTSFKKAVETGYNRVAERYLATKDREDPATLAILEDLARDLPPGSPVLDLGCGAGVPVTRWLARRFAVTGVDVSARQLELASRHIPAANFVKVDMTDLDFAPESFDAVVAFHSIIHVPRVEHPALLGKIHWWLRLSGVFFATRALGAWEREEQGREGWEDWGAPMRWSHHDGETSLALLREAGFAVEHAETHITHDVRSDEPWL